MKNNVIDYKGILSDPIKRKRLKHMYWLVLWWENEKRIAFRGYAGSNATGR